METRLLSACTINGSKIIGKETAPLTFTCQDGRTYYSVTFRMYMHFDAIEILVPDEEIYRGSIYAPIKLRTVRIEHIEARTIAQARSFLINASAIKTTIKDYIERSMQIYKEHSCWKIYKDAMISMYLNDLQRKYKVDIEPSALTYSIQHCWSVDTVEPKDNSSI